MPSSLKNLGNGLLGLLAAALFIYVYAPASRAPKTSAVPNVSETGTPGAGRTNKLAPAAPSTSSGQVKPTIRIGWTAWADAEFVTKLARRLLEQHLGCNVQLVMSDIGIQYQGVATGDLDLMLMAWLPTTHRNYWKKVSAEVIDLGPLYLNAKLGWAVPEYVPRDRLDSISDLTNPKVMHLLRDRIVGIDPGSGLMQASDKALHAYGLTSYNLIASSGAGMTAALQRAIQHHQWVVATAWRPHWIFQKWHLRFLKDPKHILGGREEIHAVARLGFNDDFDPSITAFITRMYLPLSELEKGMLDARRDGVEQAVTTYVREHPSRINYWLHGIPDSQTAPAH